MRKARIFMVMALFLVTVISVHAEVQILGSDRAVSLNEIVGTPPVSFVQLPLPPLLTT